MSSSLWLLQLPLLTPCLHSPSWPVSVPSASCPVPCEWRKAPILADQAALCRTFAFFVGGFPYKRRKISGTRGERKPGPATGQQGMHLFPRGNFQVTTIFINARRHKKWQQVNIFFPSF